MLNKHPRIHDEKHLAFIRGLPCIICMNNIETEAAHIRMAAPKAGKRAVGKAEKPDDKWTIPLCGGCHRNQHVGFEVVFWDKKDIDPIFVCLALWSVTGDHELGEQIIEANR